MQRYLNHMYAPIFSQPILFQLNMECGANKSTGFVIARRAFFFFVAVSPAFLRVLLRSISVREALPRGGRSGQTPVGFPIGEMQSCGWKNLRVKKVML